MSELIFDDGDVLTGEHLDDALQACYPDGVPETFPVDLFTPVAELTDSGSLVVRDAALQRRIDEFQDLMLTLEQEECPVKHYFASGVYGRQVTLPKGVVAIGALHLHDCINVMLTGDVTMMTVDGPKRVRAPAVFVAPKGSKKFGYVNEESVWLTFQATESTNPDEIVAATTLQRYSDYIQLIEVKE